MFALVEIIELGRADYFIPETEQEIYDAEDNGYDVFWFPTEEERDARMESLDMSNRKWNYYNN